MDGDNMDGLTVLIEIFGHLSTVLDVNSEAAIMFTELN